MSVGSAFVVVGIAKWPDQMKRGKHREFYRGTTLITLRGTPSTAVIASVHARMRGLIVRQFGLNSVRAGEPAERST